MADTRSKNIVGPTKTFRMCTIAVLTASLICQAIGLFTPGWSIHTRIMPGSEETDYAGVFMETKCVADREDGAISGEYFCTVTSYWASNKDRQSKADSEHEKLSVGERCSDCIKNVQR